MHTTTGDFVKAGDAMDVRCRKCRRNVIIWAGLIERKFPRSVSLDNARRRMKCKQCGGKMPTIAIYVHQQPDSGPIRFHGRESGLL